jgi:3-isopropylmalate/(R)-2-methylmalate dehydratase small subunit
MKIRGKTWKYGDGLTTDYMLPGRYLELTDPEEMATHAMEGIDSTFKSKVKGGDIIVAGLNCGLGSSREHAPIALKYSGISAVVAESFARIFYRNAFNVGLLAIECNGISDTVSTGDTLEIDVDQGKITVNNVRKLTFTKPPPFMIEIIEEGGLVQYLRKNLNEW